MNAFAHLPDISAVTPRTAADNALFAELAAVLHRHNALDRFGISLLHTHFPMQDGEVLLEETDTSTRTQTLRPTTTEVGANTIETSWRLGEDGHAIVNCICPTTSKGHQGSHVRHGY